MYLYLYCITKELRKPLSEVTGLENDIVYILQYHEIMAIVSNVATAKTQVSNENILRHAAVIEAIQREQTVIPVRFSSVFRNNEEALKFLENRYLMFVADLDRLHNKLEMGLRIIGRNTIQNNQDDENLTQSTQPPFTKRGLWGINKGRIYNSPSLREKGFSDVKGNSNVGADYLELQRAYYASLDENKAYIQEIESICHAQFEGIYTECKRETGASFLQGVSLNYLIYKDFLPEFRKRFHSLKVGLNELQFLCSGPWPPYHFVSSVNSAENK